MYLAIIIIIRACWPMSNAVATLDWHYFAQASGGSTYASEQCMHAYYKALYLLLATD